MKSHKRQVKAFTKYFVLTALLIMGFSLLVLFYIEITTIATSKSWVEAEENKIIQSEVTLLGEEIDLIIADLDFLRNQLLATITTSKDLYTIEEQWLIFSDSKEIYDQIRFIDYEGYESIRVNHINNTAVLVDSADLQYKGDRYYYQEAAHLNENEIYVSPFDLNTENGRVEIPRKPVLRFATPLIIENEFYGVVIVNYLGENILNKFQNLLKYSIGDLYLINEDGYYLYSGRPGKDFSFMFSDYEGISFANDYPKEWEHIRVVGDSILSENGLFSVKQLLFNTKVDLAHESKVIFSEEEWFVVSHIPNGSQDYYYVRPSAETIIRKIILKNSIYFLFLLLLSFFIALLILQNKKSFSKIRYLSEYDEMTGILNRRAGMNSLVELLRTYDERAGKMFLCYLDIDGLKLVNDTFGHAIGDELILTVVDVVKSVIRESDLFIRIGGDEFLLILHHMDKDVHDLVWERIQYTLDKKNTQENRPYNISVSRGFIEITKESSKEIEVLMKSVDAEMYRQKDLNRASMKIIK